MNKINAKIAVDPVIFSVGEGILQVLAHVREKEPYKGKYELPGGLLESNETADQAVRRKLIELLGTDDLFFKQLHTFTSPSRDPRERTISVAYISLVRTVDCNNLRWVGWDNVDFAFDHKEIVSNGRSYLKKNLDFNLMKHFLPEEFPLNQLQDLCELLEDKKYDNRNFRKKMLASGKIESLNRHEANVSHRPAKLFKFTTIQ